MSIKTMISSQKSRQKLAICAVLIFVLTLVTGFVEGQKTIEVLADGDTITVNTLMSKPETIINQAGVHLQDKDEYRLSTDRIENNTVITIYRAVPVTVEYQNQKQELITGKPTVGELLSELGYTGDMYRVEPGLNSKIQKNMHIKIVSISEQISEREEAEEYQVVRQSDPSMEKGTENVVQNGENGIKKIKVREHFNDGQKTGEDILETTVITPSRPQIIKIGVRDTVPTSRGAMRFSRAIYMEASAYLPGDGGGAGITATGMAARHGVVAVDPNVIPLGTRLFIPGYGVAIAADTGGAIQGAKIDLCMDDYGEAISFGRQSVKVYILD